MAIPRVTPIEIIFADDTFNQVFRAAWWGGLMDFPVDASLLGGFVVIVKDDVHDFSVKGQLEALRANLVHV